MYSIYAFYMYSIFIANKRIIVFHAIWHISVIKRVRLRIPIW